MENEKFARLAAGELGQICGINESGLARCWGALSNEVVKNPEKAPAVKLSKIAVGYTEACAITQQGNAVCWGGSDWRSGKDWSAVAPPGSYKDIAMGGGCACAIQESSGMLRCWGFTEGACNGDVNEYDNLEEDAFSALGSLARLSLAKTINSQHGCAVSVSGAIICGGFGNNLGGIFELASTPQELKFKEISAEHHLYTFTKWSDTAGDYVPQFGGTICGITLEGKAQCWGELLTSNGSGDFPAGDYSMITTGTDHACAVTTNGELRCIGDDSYDQLAFPW